MGFHTYPIDRADSLRDPERYRYCSREELLAALSPGPTATVADLGSGTGFYTDDVAPAFGTVYAVDVQPAMHDRYREHGIPGNVDPVTAEVGDLPFADGDLDRAFSTMTYHEFAGDGALDELSRVLRDGGLLVTVDWTSEGSGDVGPPTDQRYSLADAMAHHREAGFVVEDAEDRPETFKLVARN